MRAVEIVVISIAIRVFYEPFASIEEDFLEDERISSAAQKTTKPPHATIHASDRNKGDYCYNDNRNVFCEPYS